MKIGIEEDVRSAPERLIKALESQLQGEEGWVLSRTPGRLAFTVERTANRAMIQSRCVTVDEEAIAQLPRCVIDRIVADAYASIRDSDPRGTE